MSPGSQAPTTLTRSWLEVISCPLAAVMMSLTCRPAWAAGAPIAANAFGRFTPGGIVANLALLPAAALSVATGVVGALAGFVSETAAAHFNNLAALVTRAMTGVSRAVAGLGWANFEVEEWGFGACAAWYASLLLTRAWICYNSRTKQNELGW